MTSSQPAPISLTALVATLISWGLTVVLAANLLSGPFAERTCQTHCVQTLAIAAVGILIAGLLIPQYRRTPRHPVTTLCLLALLVLLAIYLTTFLVGTIFG